MGACGDDGSAQGAGGTSGVDASSDANPPDAATDTGVDDTRPDGSDARADAVDAQIADVQGGDDQDAGERKCRSDQLDACMRGMYMSPYTDHVGQITLEGETEHHRYILGDAAKEQRVFDFVIEHGITSVALYNLYPIMGDPSLSDSLESFIARLRGAGVLLVNAIGDTTLAAWDRIADFQQSHARFDGMVTEIEFWAGGATEQEFLDTLVYIRSLSMVAPGGGAPTLSVYVGWVDEAQVTQMAPYIDRAYVHVYVDDPAQAYAYGSERVAMFAKANATVGTEVDVWPIFSAEDHAWAAGGETFMGEWLADNGIEGGERELLEAWEAAPVDGVELTGVQYYSYFFLERYLP
jgi:hypothetical protein